MTRAKLTTGVASLVVLIVLAWSGVCAADPLNPSFEMTYAGLPWPRPLPLYWGHVDHPSFNSYCTNLWSTNGGMSVTLLNRIGQAVSPGSYESLYQYVDLTGIASIKFDVWLSAYPAGLFEHFEASLLVDGVPLWSRDAGGLYLDQEVSVASLPGWRRLEIRNTALDAGTFSAAYWTQWDNLRFVKGPTVVPATVDLDPGTLNPQSNGQWITCYIKLGPDYDVKAIDGTTVTLNDIPAYIGSQGWATGPGTESNVADYDSDGVLERMVKFERAAVQAIVTPPEATVAIKGQLVSGTLFEGTAVLHVLHKDVKSK
jgi:hypothetical protein